jgi:hypothetical protein
MDGLNVGNIILPLSLNGWMHGKTGNSSLQLEWLLITVKKLE